MDVQEHSPLPFDFIVRTGFAFDEVELLDKSLVFVVAAGGQLEAAHGAVAVTGHVFVGPELVAGEQDPDAEVGKIAFFGQQGGGGELIPA